jgi:hypothetical protein
MVITKDSMAEATTPAIIRVDLQQAIAYLHEAQHAAEAAAAELAQANSNLAIAEDADRAARSRGRAAEAALLLAVYEADV